MRSYHEAEEYLLNVPKFTMSAGGPSSTWLTRKNTLEDTGRFLELLGNPGSGKKVIHVAGTNGKGSVCAYLCSILGEAGYRVGMFCSPHLVEMRERFRINGIPVEENVFTKAFEAVMDKIERMREELDNPTYHPTFFEFLFLMGMLIFEEKGVDYIVLETGLGGRLDATNTIKSPVLTVITEIGMDHTEYLGDTVGKIAQEKAGILKPCAPVVFCDKRKEASEVILKRAKMLGIQAFPVAGGDYINVNLTNKSIDFSFHSRYYDYIRLTVTTKALYQVENASIAARCIEVLQDPKVSLKHLTEGIRKTVWEGRMEEIMPGIFLEGAHNEDGIRAFVQSVSADSCQGKRYMLFSTVSDKDYESMVRILEEKPLFEMAALTRLDSGRAASTEVLRAAFERYGSGRCEVFAGSRDALEFLMERKEERDYIYIVGSLYLVGEIKALLRRRTDD
ncbi:dihydrofolate synthase/folylpolyglutamate synthase [Kineothrix alysoides]|uniref:tetrahydrofolate synthase n=1 Tax=Kineothrix alysoides TaxID=1469948 RepID=A0A4R1R5B1_9FIRM|nr:folylpolyglutamate synthase/dihydrofolate synthase family protein [Kineothrix alysoides]TCL60472.1 dihydrofolate synthase/folylpolyglutamate synthase [Kineothrix alysoides]